MIGLDVRPLADADIEPCAAMLASTEPWITLGRGIDACRAVVGDTRRERFVGCVDGAIVGVLILHVDGPLGGYLQTLCVADGWRGRGIGSALVAFAEARVFSERRDLFLCVSSFNHGARGLYERLGYVYVGTLVDFLTPGCDELLYRKRRAPLV